MSLLFPIDKIGILGATDGMIPLALKIIRQGIPLVFVDHQKAHLERLISLIKKKLDDQKKKAGLEDATIRQMISCIQLGMDTDILAPVSTVIVAEGGEVEARSAAQKIDTFISPKALLMVAHPTSLASFYHCVREAQRLVGWHLLAPSGEIKAVEIIRGVKAGASFIERAELFAETLGIPSFVTNDFPGFIFNRVMASMVNEAATTVYEGVATANTVDTSIRLAAGMAEGPLRLADSIGLDHVLDYLSQLRHATGATKYVPCPLLVKYVEAGYLGKKSGKGFFNYTP